MLTKHLYHPDHRPRKAAYALPTLFTAGNLFLGFAAIIKAFQGGMAASSGALASNRHLELAAIMIGIAILLDGLDGRIARLTNTVSDFGRELDSLADVITFGIAPAVLAFIWGVQFVETADNPVIREQLHRAGYFVAFLFLLCGASRLARFNITTNPVPKNPGRPDRKYFVGLPIPAAAGFVAAVVYAADSIPVQFWVFTVIWLFSLGLVSFLMVSTWRYRSFKDLNLLRPRSPLMVVLFGALIYAILNYSQPVLLAMAGTYVSSGVIVRAAGIIRRRFSPRRELPETQVG
ncbi:MAG TPA: CDP-diacylglycerol--serine O-phosphatidyltransferase [Solibacterales bacterium]|nr:CDP-diacylglycerol--serine O-phosphatidyltransferase [Bryobacterales bacterium]